MSSPLRVRVLTREDLAFADSLRALAGWNQTIADWERFLALEPEGCFLADWNGAPAGTATTTVYGLELAWIGMMLVHPAQRRRGVGRALLERCIEYLRGRGVCCLKLDATPDGKKLYDGLGFKAEWTLTRWEHVGFDSPSAVTESRVKGWTDESVRRLEPLDSAAFGIPRQRLLRALALQSRSALVLESEADQIEAYGLLRNGSRALYLGPVVAGSADTAIRVIEALLAQGRGERVFWDIPDQNLAAVEWARRHEFIPQRSLVRMVLGENRVQGDPRKQFALAGPESG